MCVCVSVYICASKCEHGCVREREGVHVPGSISVHVCQGIHVPASVCVLGCTCAST